ncbi:hypothetical protein BDK61_1485 [Haloarcula quadrata]|uniref:DUF8125 domain-containing protein n=1 Tax=Haloarcula quadrata TaxID=182779 RepID=A0A495R4E4_9EURY|nr:hypothetical protein [Haloarcula quadrata]RKS82185.1 hypothetical protein BDK61_1485 [Haloarcula quadrata]
MTDERDTQNGNLVRVKQAVTSNSAVVAVMVGLLTMGVMSGRLDVPAWAIDVMRGGAVAGAIGYIAGGKLADLLSEPPETVEVVEVDAERDYAQTWFVPPEWWNDRVEEDGSPWFREGSGNWGVREMDYDPDEECVIVEEGALEAELNDDELATWRSAVYECRGRLRTWAHRGRVLRQRLNAVVEAVESRYWDTMANDELDRKAAHPDVVHDELDRELGDIREQTQPMSDDDVLEQTVREIVRDHGDVDADEFDRLDEPDFDLDEPQRGRDGE